MGIPKKIQRLNAQIVDTERLLTMVKDHPLMSISLKEKLESLKLELETAKAEFTEAKVTLLFSGKAVVGSQGIKSSFVSKAIPAFQDMVKTQVALHRFGRVGNRGQIKTAAGAELYLTALPVGSFGVELSQLEETDLFDASDVGNAIKEVITLVTNTSIDDATFEKTIEKTPKRNLINLKNFLKQVVNEKSILIMESGDTASELSDEQVAAAYERVAPTEDELQEIFMEVIFRGLLLDSGRFEAQGEDGLKISGFISNMITEEQRVEYDQKFLNKTCVIHLMIHKTKFRTGNEKTDYELLGIREI